MPESVVYEGRTALFVVGGKDPTKKKGSFDRRCTYPYEESYFPFGVQDNSKSASERAKRLLGGLMYGLMGVGMVSLCTIFSSVYFPCSSC